MEGECTRAERALRNWKKAARRLPEAVQQIVSHLRGLLSLPPVMVTVTAAFPDTEEFSLKSPEQPQAPQVEGPPVKRARRSLSFSPVNEDSSTRIVSVQTPEVKVST